MTTAILYECRCDNCYQTLNLSTDEAESEFECKWCGKTMVAPAVTADRIERAVCSAHVDTAGAGNRDVFRREANIRRRASAYGPRTGSRKCSDTRNARSSNPGLLSASRSRRLCAVIVDQVLGLVAHFLGLIPIFALLSCDLIERHHMSAFLEFLTDAVVPSAQKGDWSELTISGEALYGLLAMESVLIMFLIFQARMIAVRGQTLGKKLLGIKIIDSTGGAPGLFYGVVIRSGFRWCIYFLPLMFTGYVSTLVWIVALSDIAMICLEPPRCIHDRVAGTYVVNA